ncbi:hypothetical protein Y032_0008g130 [Ancylostoma ceylanicum]|uniref:Uncharacterized protein n=1 Tax=Ancylostoma ceylanicum TaxID=53326 RepID=A0A016VJA7_9BILA|nr:hypothetical protein Y032_0008g130 [Ancylostoma ceylanicum]
MGKQWGHRGLFVWPPWANFGFSEGNLGGFRGETDRRTPGSQFRCHFSPRRNSPGRSRLDAPGSGNQRARGLLIMMYQVELLGPIVPTCGASGVRHVAERYCLGVQNPFY